MSNDQQWKRSANAAAIGAKTIPWKPVAWAKRSGGPSPPRSWAGTDTPSAVRKRGTAPTLATWPAGPPGWSDGRGRLGVFDRADDALDLVVVEPAGPGRQHPGEQAGRDEGGRAGAGLGGVDD